MIVVTGGYGFIGSNLVHALNQRGRDDIWVVDDLTDGRKFVNLVGATVADYHHWSDFPQRFAQTAARGVNIDAVYHLGACSDTLEWDGRRMMAANFEFSRDLLDTCEHHQIPLIYASSAAVYGLSEVCVEAPAYERPLNVYGYSKLAFDQHVRYRLPNLRTRVVGLRYFNVYGPREQHKGRMASVMYHFDQQLRGGASLALFGASHGVAAGEQSRDFVFVDDVVAQTLWFGSETSVSGIFNCGTGSAATFNDVAQAVVAHHGHGTIQYIPFPVELLGAYQHRTCADLRAVRLAGFDLPLRNVTQGVRVYLDRLRP